ncbi:MFS transporter [Maricaulis sp.]|uniref:MFS transporter n=1 Tax=Maricaulis sp. TaxID=1486257 RepID=UPI00260DC6C9|nr:MFS transporter [Maricaulis sp.]
MTETSTQTRPEDGISFAHRLAYGSGAFANNLLAGSIVGMIVLLNENLGVSLVMLGVITALPRLFDALTDPIVGYISDNFKSKWGRRRPFIFVGAILVGLCFFLLWQFPEGQEPSFYVWWYTVGSVIFFLAYTIYATPWVALGYELTPDYDQRTLLMGTQNFIGQVAFFLPPYMLVIAKQSEWFANPIDGARVVATGVAIIVIICGIIPAIFLKERMADIAHEESEKTGHGRDVWKELKGFFVSMGQALSFVPFLKICFVTFLVFNGFILIASYGYFVLSYYVFSGDTEAGAELGALVATVGSFANFAIVAFVTWLASRIGQKRTFIIAISLAILGYALKTFAYSQEFPWLILLPAPLMAFGLGSLFTLMPSMMADIVDQDELRTGQRREGMFASIYWWVVKLGQTVASMAGAWLLASTGLQTGEGAVNTDATLLLLRVYDIGLPILLYALAIGIIMTLNVSREKSEAVRAELEKRRGLPDAAPAE